MGQSMDFSNGILRIREAHADSVAILEKWRELIEAPGEVALSVRGENGEVFPIILPSIRTAIERYLGGIFSQLTLTNEYGTVILRLNSSGAVELVDADGNGAPLETDTIIASRLSGKNGELPITGNVALHGGTIQDAIISNMQCSAGTITRAKFTGPAAFTGTTTISGVLSVGTAAAATVAANMLVCGKQVLKFGVVGIRDNALNGPTDGDIWTGDVAVLERAGIFPEPTWADCTYIPEHLSGAASIHIYWGTPDTGDTMIINDRGGTDFSTSLLAAWPYKMYEAVDGGYRIRFLPFTGNEGRMHYVRAGEANDATALISIKETMSGTGISATIDGFSLRSVDNYTCPRFMAEIEVTESSGSTTTNHRLYRV